MITEAAFLAEIAARPDDDAPRLIFADWLEERGESERAEFIRVQCELGGFRSLKHNLVACEAKGPPALAGGRKRCRCRPCALRRRENELLGCEFFPAWCPRVLADNANTSFYRRGFIESVIILCQQWLTHGPEILAAVPTIREVHLADKQPWNFGNRRWGWSIYRGEESSDWLIPLGIFEELIGGAGTYGYENTRYKEKKEAEDDLSQACLAYARRRVPGFAGTYR